MKVRVLNHEIVGQNNTLMQECAVAVGAREVSVKMFPRSPVPPGNYTVNPEDVLREKAIVEAGLDGRRTQARSYVVLDIRPENLKPVAAAAPAARVAG